jgi:hypothetical protein
MVSSHQLRGVRLIRHEIAAANDFTRPIHYRMPVLLDRYTNAERD